MARTIVPVGLEGYVTEWQMSPGFEHASFIFMSGFTGANAAGILSPNPEDQIEAVFEKVRMVLQAAGLDFEHLVEMTSFHVGVREHLETFKKVRARYLVEPFPAWTAIEVAGFVREGAVIEVKCVARRSQLRSEGPPLKAAKMSGPSLEVAEFPGTAAGDDSQQDEKA